MESFDLKHIMTDKKQMQLSDFQLYATLGTGSFGRVRLVSYKNEYFAMKVMRKTRIVEMKQENHIKWEQQILSSIRHPFITNLETSFQDIYFLYFVLEFVGGGEFFTLLKRAGKLQLPHCVFYASQIVLVLNFLHSNRVVYRNLKPENLLMDLNGYLKLTDFCFAKRLEPPFKTWTLCGTPEYIAPEILLNRGHSFSVDWWALGILIFEMFSGNPPFVDDNPMKIYQKILDGKIEWPMDPKKKKHIIPKRAREFIAQLLCKNLSQRLGRLDKQGTYVMKHPFFEGLNWEQMLDKSVTKVPWKPEIKQATDTKHFDDYDENTDTENVELKDDPFMGMSGWNVPNTIGLAIGGAKDVNTFRKCIEENIMPKSGSITFSAVLYEYYFDTKTVSHLNKTYFNSNNDDIKSMEGCNDGSKLFYPTYCYAKVQTINFENPYVPCKRNDEYFMTMGLNSNIAKNTFKRKHLNLVIVLDKSGSMSDTFKFADTTTKMMIANEAVNGLLNHLTEYDRFGLITFDGKAQILMELQSVGNFVKINALKQRVLQIYPGGGTNFESGMLAALSMYKNINYNKSKEYENRIIFVTDAQPNIGNVDDKSLLNLVSKNAFNVNKRIYTTIIGVGLDFDAGLVNKITQTRGCNYFSVKSNQEFIERMTDEFENMVTPLVYNVLLSLKCEGNSCKIDKVYGSNNVKYAENILQNGEITKIHTLFPSKKSKKTGKIKGGILLIKLKKTDINDKSNINVTIEVSFEDRNDTKFKTSSSVVFKNHNIIAKNENQNKEGLFVGNYYDNLGIRKGILLCKYAELLSEWIESEEKMGGMQLNNKLRINKKHKIIFRNFLEHFKSEMKTCKDDTLAKEMNILNALIKSENLTDNHVNIDKSKEIKPYPINEEANDTESYVSTIYNGFNSLKQKWYG